MIPWLLLLLAVIGALFTANVFRPNYRSPTLSVISFFAGWLTAELAVHWLVFQAVVAAGLIAWGALSAWPGWVALPILAVSWIFLWRSTTEARAAADVVERALCDGLGADYRTQIRPEAVERFSEGIAWRALALPVPRHPAVERVRNITYTDGLRLDVYRHRDRPTGCPAVLQVHGGGWVVGSKNEQGLPLMYQLAAQGWVGVNADYRLSPRATFPDPLIDLKRALRWIRQEGPAYGIAPDFVAVTGGSAGGHLAALVALTANEPAYQPGFEDVDTSVRACVAFYGVYDFTNRHGIWPHGGLAKLLRQRVMKAALDEAREAYEQASPMSRVSEQAPPFLIIHGDRDTLVPVEEARRFFALLRAAIPGRVAYAEIPGAQHAFELFPSARTVLVLQGVERFLAWVYSRYAAERDAAPPAGVAARAGGLTAAARRL